MWKGARLGDIPTQTGLEKTAEMHWREKGIVTNHPVQHGHCAIAATATENGLRLCTSNVKHYRPIQELKLKVFKP